MGVRMDSDNVNEGCSTGSGITGAWCKGPGLASKGSTQDSFSDFSYVLIRLLPALPE